MSKLQCSREVGALRGICSDYSGYRKSSRSIRLITDWNDITLDISGAYAYQRIMPWKMDIWTDHSVFHDKTIGMLALQPHIWTKSIRTKRSKTIYWRSGDTLRGNSSRETLRVWAEQLFRVKRFSHLLSEHRKFPKILNY